MSLSVVDVLRVAPPFDLAFVEPVVVLDPRFGFECALPDSRLHVTLNAQQFHAELPQTRFHARMIDEDK